MKESSKILDKSAISFSLLCAVHCVGTPFLLIMTPALASSVLTDELFHKALLFVVLPLSIYTLIKAYQHHRQGRILFYGGTGLLIMLAAALFGHDILGENGEKIATLTGATILALAHLKNIKLCKEQDCHREA
jgi:hypothetical protein